MTIRELRKLLFNVADNQDQTVGELRRKLFEMTDQDLDISEIIKKGGI